MGGSLDGAFMDVKCMTGRSGGFCRPEMMGIKNVMFQAGGEPGKTYDVVLRVWAIVEGIAYTGGMPVGDHFYIGGRGTTANYGPCGLEIGNQTYFLNRHMQPGGDSTRKFEYTTPAIKIPGGAMVTMFCRDTNNHLTMNSERGRHVIMNPPPELAAKIGMQPVEGHFIYLKVMSSTPAP